MATQVNDSNFDAVVLQSQLPVLVDFWAPWCGPCRAIGPIIDELANEYEGKLSVVKLNVDESPSTPGKYGIRAIPTLILFKNGEVVEQVTGAVSKSSITTMIVGGGPAGITAALYLCRSGLSVAQIEMLAPGGQILKTESIENYPGFPKGIKGWEMADAFAAHLDGYELDRYNDAVLKMEQVPGGWLFSIGKETIVGKAVVVCSGANPRPLGVPRETELTGRGVSYCALCDGNFFRDQVVAVVGGGNSALEEALYLSRIASKLYLIHRREGFRAAKVYQDKIRAASDKIELVLDTVVTGLIGEGSLQGLQLKNVKTGEETQLPVDGMFVFVGYEPQNSFLPAGLELDPQGFIITDCEMRTNLPGLFAAGDIRSKMCRQVTTAVGDGATAATAAFTYLEQLDA